MDLEESLKIGRYGRYTDDSGSALDRNLYTVSIVLSLRRCIRFYRCEWYFVGSFREENPDNVEHHTI